MPFAQPLATILVIPCYNEEQRLDPARFRETDAGLLFVDDGSRDGTRSRLEELCRQDPARRAWINLSTNRGKAEAVRAGMRAGWPRATRAIGYWDADLATPLEALPLFEQCLQQDPERMLVLGSRVQLLGRDIRRSPARHYSGRVFATLASLALNLPVYDTQCGAKLFRASPRLAGLFEQPFLSRWLFDVEVLFRYQLSGNDRRGLYELPLPCWHDVPGSKLTWTVPLRAPFELARLTWHYRRLALKFYTAGHCDVQS